jgi:hypothetical protein
VAVSSAEKFGYVDERPQSFSKTLTFTAIVRLQMFFKEVILDEEVQSPSQNLKEQN